jgi:glucose/arabinose dehydrogenase
MKKIVSVILFLVSAPLPAIDLPLDEITLPSGFDIEVYSLGHDQVRGISFAPDGTLFAGSKSGTVYAILPDKRKLVIERGLFWPVSVDYHNGDLYVSTHSQVYVYRKIQNNYRNPEKEVFFQGFPSNKTHGWRYIKFGPDGYLYASIGMPCNICEKKSPIYGSIIRISPNGSTSEVYAEGIRFSVGFDWHPQSGDLWFTDNGRDGLGDSLPADELNKAERRGLFFGFPYVHGKAVREPEFNSTRISTPMVPPQWELPAHVAPLGISFYNGNKFPQYYKGGIFIAEHGSVDSSELVGYRISFVKITNNKAVNYEVFAEGWVKEYERWGRITDVDVGIDGALYVSDERAHAIYRISYKGSSRRTL